MGLVRGIARTAAIAGTATAVSNRVSRRQANRWSEQAAAEEPQPEQVVYVQAEPAAPAGPSTDDKLDQLRQLGELKTAGILTEAEFEAQKAKVLAG